MLLFFARVLLVLKIDLNVANFHRQLLPNVKLKSMQRMPLFKAYKFTFDKELKGNITLKTEYGKEAK